MKIIMDFRKYDGVVGGVEQGVIQVTKYVSSHGHEVVLLCKDSRRDQVEKIFDGSKNLKIVSLDVDTHIICKKNSYLDSVTIQEIAQKEGARVIHFPYNWSFPKNKKVPSCLTVHDVIPFTFREAQDLYTNLFKYKPAIKKACKLNDMIATVSSFSRQDIAKKAGVPLEKIRVIYNGLREPNPEDKSLEEDIKKKFNIGDRFILNVGGIHERKNIVRLIHAFSGLVTQWSYHGKLIITGKVTGAPYQVKMKKLCDKAIAETKMEKRVIFTNFITEKELDSLFRMADLLIYPSLYEGFGIPILEAMKIGIPVITSNVTAMPEVAGEGALLVDPHSIEDMTDGMAKILNDKKFAEELKSKGPGIAKEFTWEKTSESYLKLYEDISS